MDRSIAYTQEQGRSTDFLFAQRAAMIGLGQLAQAILGSGPLVFGLPVTPTSPASLSVNVGAGQIYSLQPVDATAYGVLAADTTDQIVKQGIALASQTLTFTAPATAGYSINYLIEATYEDQDTNPVVLPYFNSANPSQPLSGQNNSGAAQATERQGVCVLTVKAGAAAPTGSQTTPAPDAGYVGIAVVTVANGQTQITSGNISAYQAPVSPTGGLLNVTAPAGTKSTALATTAFAAATGGVVGTARNLRAVLTAAGTSLTFTADEIILESALGGTPFRLASFNKTLNVATTGAGGMDTGAAPASGYVAIYAIYNPTTSTAALLAASTADVVAPETYQWGHMPAGYTLSGLISVWPTNGSAQLVAGAQQDREFSYGGIVNVFSASGLPTVLTNLGISAAIPRNARRQRGSIQIANVTTNGSYGMVVAGDTGAYEYFYHEAYVPTGAGNGTAAPFNLPVTTSQTIGYMQVGTNTSGTYSININGYSI